MHEAVFTARLDLSAGPQSVTTARAVARLLLGEWGVTDPDLVDRVELVTAEIVANVARHTSGRGTLELTVDDSITVAAVDGSSSHPNLGNAADHDGGRGLLIIDAMCSGWGSQTVPGGKRVWARFDPGEDGGS
jgi:anti-sigma regulatory factor (Ser/Thr protein kinase)